MKKVLLLTMTVVVFYLILASCAMAMDAGAPDAHAGGLLPALPEQYVPARFGSIPLPPSGELRYPYEHSPFILRIECPDQVEAGEDFVIKTEIDNTMSSLDDPNWGDLIFYQQLYCPGGLERPSSWSEAFQCRFYSSVVRTASGSITEKPVDWLSEPFWYRAGVISVPAGSGSLIIAPEQIGHRMGPWSWMAAGDLAEWTFSPVTIDEPGDYTFELCMTTAAYVDSVVGEQWMPELEPISFNVHVVRTIYPATVTLDPQTLNLKSKGNFVTAYVELPELNVKDVDLSTVTLNSTIPALPAPSAIGDHDADGIPDMMVKFSRPALIDSLGGTGDILMTITGEAGGKTFSGSDTVRVI